LDRSLKTLGVESPAAGWYYLGLNPCDTTDFGCAEMVGYELSVEEPARRLNCLPMII